MLRKKIDRILNRSIKEEIILYPLTQEVKNYSSSIGYLTPIKRAVLSIHTRICLSIENIISKGTSHHMLWVC
jgi:hypothetical protein